MSRDWTEEKISSLIDGSLEDDGEATTLRQALERDPEARIHAERVRKSNALLREAFDVPADEPMPAAIEAAIFGEPGKLAVLRPRGSARTWVPVAIAASLALVIGFGAGGLLQRPQGPAIAVLGDAVRDGALHAALESLPSGDMSAEGVQPMLTFRDGSGRPCREFEVTGELPEMLEFGIACRSPAGSWQVEIIVAAPVTQPGPDGYAPASGPGSDALDAMLDALGAGPAISPDEEAALLSGGWRATP